MRFHLDEHVPGGLASTLRAHGHDVLTTAEVGLLEANDELHLAFAVNQGRVIVTHDRDYPIMHAQGIEHAGILYCHQQKYSIGQLLMMCLLVADCYTQDEMRGRLEYL
jgi:predicted nuclease of predicted toxin-antitoxin system